MDYPKVTVIIPQLGREEGLKKCVESINKSTYPKQSIEIIIEDGNVQTVPVKVRNGLSKATGDLIIYAANDMYFESDAISIAVQESKKHGLVAFNSGEVYPDEGNICEHFLIRKDLIPLLDKGEIFDTDFYHVGCDNYLWAQAKKLGEVFRSTKARIVHHHFTQGAIMDEVYKKGWSHTEEDRKTLAEKLKKLE